MRFYNSPPPANTTTHNPIFGQVVKFANHLFISICSTFKRGGGGEGVGKYRYLSNPNFDSVMFGKAVNLTWREL